MPSQHLYEPLRRNPQCHAALEQLREARQGASALRLDVWTLAVEMSSLLDVGCTMTQLRLLVCSGLIEHAKDVTKPSHQKRSFRRESPMKFGPQTCFVLTEAGVRFLETVDSTRCGGKDERLNGRAHTNSRQVPVWDPEARELRVGDRVVKRFRRPAPVLERVLAAFQEMEWPAHLDDPLPPAHGIVPEERLRDTVRRLNRCQDPVTVRFASNGLGAGIRWHWETGRLGEEIEPTDEPHLSHA